jgi:hypothetical protein
MLHLEYRLADNIYTVQNQQEDHLMDEQYLSGMIHFLFQPMDILDPVGRELVELRYMFDQYRN